MHSGQFWTKWQTNRKNQRRLIPSPQVLVWSTEKTRWQRPSTGCVKSGRRDSNPRRPAWEAASAEPVLQPQVFTGSEFTTRLLVLQVAANNPLVLRRKCVFLRVRAYAKSRHGRRPWSGSPRIPALAGSPRSRTRWPRWRRWGPVRTDGQGSRLGPEGGQDGYVNVDVGGRGALGTRSDEWPG